MKLLFIAPTDSLTGGGEISHFELIMAAKRRGHQVHVVVPAKGKLATHLREHGVKATAIRYWWWGSFADITHTEHNLAAVGRISKLIRSLKVDCAVTNSLNIPWGALAAATTDVPHVWISREMPLYQFKYLDDHYDFIEKYSNLIMANSKTNADYIKGRVKKRSVGYFYPYVDEQHKLSGTIKETRLVNIGSIQPGKNQLELIKAAAILHRKGILKTKIILIGSQWNKPYIQKLKANVKNYGLQNIVRISNFKKDPYEVVGPNDIFVQTSVYESFGRTTVEALKLGLVTVAADIPATREIFAHGYGELYKAGQPKDLAKVLERVLRDPQHHKTLALKAQKNVSESFDEPACHNPFFNALEKVNGQPNPGRELRHLALQFDGLLTVRKNHDRAVHDRQKIIEQHERSIDDIVTSKAWKASKPIREANRLAHSIKSKKKR